MANTRIDFLYRDACNYKRFTTVVIAGTLSDEQIREMMSLLYDGDWFIPEQVGLPANRFADFTQDDHPWCEICAEDFSLTDAQPTESMTANELYENFVKLGGCWDPEGFTNGII